MAVSACGGGGGSTGSVPPPTPTPLLTVSPTLKPTAAPSGKPVASPSPGTSASPVPSGSPTPGPSGSPTAAPSGSPTAAPSATPTAKPTVAPTIPPTSPPTIAPTPTPTPSGRTIQHIVVIVQENRTVDNIFQGFPNANTVSTGQMALPGGGQTTVPLQMVPLGVPCDLDHSHIAWGGDWDGGKMDGFAGPQAHIHCVGGATPPPSTYAYSYVNPADVAPYWSLAHNYTLLDNVFEDPTSPSFQSHLDLISGQTNNTSENPQYQGNTANVWGCDSPVGTTVALYNGMGDQPGFFPCFAAPYATVADLLDAKGLSWKYYAPAIGETGDIWSAFDAISSVRNGPDWNNVISPETLILSQATNLASVTYVVPSFADSDHASSNSNTGPSWVASVINAIGASPNWSTTAIFLLWDDWGGWYDHVPPTVSNNFATGGLRIPVLCISPYSENASPGSPVVDHTRHGEAGILAFIEENFALGTLGRQDAVDSPLNDCFNFNQSPKPFIAVPSIVPASHFRFERPSGIVPDDDK